jgi:hypothetical protein
VLVTVVVSGIVTRNAARRLAPEPEPPPAASQPATVS